jgi:hypothetical protein
VGDIFRGRYTPATLHYIETMMRPQKFGEDEDVLAAYLAAHYKVTGTASPFVLRVGRRSAELASVHLANRANCSAFITAWNPQSVARSQADNCASQKRLESELGELGVTLIAGVGMDPAGVWPDEPSVLAVGISRNEAERVGRRFGQRAIVWNGESAIPELIDLVMPSRRG